MKDSVQLHSNKHESPGFLRGALMWRCSITPRILPSLLLMTCYSLLIVGLDQYWRPLPHLDLTPFEYTPAWYSVWCWCFEPIQVTSAGGRLENYGVALLIKAETSSLRL